MSDNPDCRCIDIEDVMRLTLEGIDLPHCTLHDGADNDASAPLALNDDAGLVAKIGRSLGATNLITEL